MLLTFLKMVNIKKNMLAFILNKKNTQISLIRIAAHFNEISILNNLSEDLKN